jgi:hypothetical protein
MAVALILILAIICIFWGIMIIMAFRDIHNGRHVSVVLGLILPGYFLASYIVAIHFENFQIFWMLKYM